MCDGKYNTYSNRRKHKQNELEVLWGIEKESIFNTFEEMERRIGERRKADRRTGDVYVEKDRRVDDRRKGDRRVMNDSNNG